VATVERDQPSSAPPLQTQVDIGKYFNGSAPGAHITFTTPDGKKLLEMTGWSQALPNQKDGTAEVLRDRRPSDAEFFTVGASFVSPDDEHYYGLGQSHEGRSQRLRTLSRHQQRLRRGLGQPIEDHHRAGLQRADPLELPGRRPGLVLCDRRRYGG
jgi:hypothetical protein